MANRDGGSATKSRKFYRRARFLTSAAKLKQAPPDEGIEVAFVGRSNAGKSSTINLICDQKSLARTSRTPGRTQLLNFFTLSERQRLVDLPGYGFAKVGLDVKREWQGALADYLEQRQCLAGLIQLMDIRHPCRPADLQLLEWAAQIGLPVHVMLTKADKVNRHRAETALAATWGEVETRHSKCGVQVFSARKGYGVERVYQVLDQWFGR